MAPSHPILFLNLGDPYYHDFCGTFCYHRPLTKNFTRKHASNVDLILFTGGNMDLHKFALSTKNVAKVQKYEELI